MQECIKTQLRTFVTERVYQQRCLLISGHFTTRTRTAGRGNIADMCQKINNLYMLRLLNGLHFGRAMCGGQVFRFFVAAFFRGIVVLLLWNLSEA